MGDRHAKKSKKEKWWRKMGMNKALPGQVPHGVGFDVKLAGKEISGIGAETGAHYEDIFKGGMASTKHRSVRAKEYRLGARKLSEAWYKPYLKAAVRDPITEMGTVAGAGEAIGSGSLQAFQEVGEASREAMGESYERAAGEVGEEGAFLPADREMRGELAAMGTKKDIAEEAKSAAEAKAIETEAGAGKTLQAAKLAARVARKKAGTDILGQKAQVEAKTAATGMAYSGAAEAAAGQQAEAGAQTLADISKGETQSEQAYSKAMKDIGLEREATERDWRGAELEYATGLGDMYSKAGTLLEGVQTQLTDIMAAHKAYGTTGAGAEGMSSMVGKFTGQSFKETGLEEAKGFEEQIGTSQTFIDALQQAQSDILGGVPTEALGEEE